MDSVWSGLSGTWQALAGFVSWTSGKVRGVAPEEGIQKLRATLGRIQQREQTLRDEVEACAARVRGFLAKGNRREAMLALKRQKVYDAQLEGMQKMGTTVEAQILGLEATLVNADVYAAMKDGASALQSIHRSVGLENVEHTLLDLQEHADHTAEVAQSLSMPVCNVFDALDDTELERELGLLESEVAPSGDDSSSASMLLAESEVPSGDDSSSASMLLAMPIAPAHALDAPPESADADEQLTTNWESSKKCMIIEKAQ